MSDLLTQDQINALLGSGGLDGAASLDIGNDSPQGMDPLKRAADIGKAFDLFCEQARTVLGTVLSKELSLSTDTVVKGDTSAAGSHVNGAALCLKITLKNGFAGDLYLLLAQKDVAILSDLMMMGDGSAVYTEDHKDAIAELASQIMGSYTIALGGMCSVSVSANPAEVSDFSFENPAFDFASCDTVQVKMSVPGFESAGFILAVESDLGTQLAQKLSSTGDGGAAISSSNDMMDFAGTPMSSVDDSSSMRESSGGESFSSKAPKENVDALLDVELDVAIELGRTNLSIKKVLDLAPGAIVELDRLAGEPVDLLVNGKTIARGEVVVVDENFGIRIVSLVSAEDRIRSLR